jgi:hypothetical protein
MTQIGVGIGVNKSPVKQLGTKPYGKTESNRTSNDVLQKTHTSKVLQKQLSTNSSDRRLTNDNADDDNSNSFESHSDADIGNHNDKQSHSINNAVSLRSRHAMNVNWASRSTTAVNTIVSEQNLPAQQQHRQVNGKTLHSVKSLAHSMCKSPMVSHESSLTSKRKAAGKTLPQSNSAQPSSSMMPSGIDSSPSRMYPAPQPRPETLAIMSDEVFHEFLKARQSPRLPVMSTSTVLLSSQSITGRNPCSSNSSPIVERRSSTCVQQAHETHVTPSVDARQENDLAHHRIDKQLETAGHSLTSPSPLSVKQILSNLDHASDDGWRFSTSHNSLDIPFIDETDFEDLGE